MLEERSCSCQVLRDPYLGFLFRCYSDPYPLLSWLVTHVTFENMLVTELWLSFLYASYNGAAVVALTEVMPVHVRTVGFSLAYSLATAIFGGFTPLVSTWLIERTGDKAAPGFWMALAAVSGLAATLILYRRDGRQKPLDRHQHI